MQRKTQTMSPSMSKNDSPASNPKQADHLIDPIFESAPCAMLLFAPNGELLKVNPAFMQWVGHDGGSEHESMEVDKRFDGHNARSFIKLKEQVNAVVGGSAPIPLHMRLTREDGSALPVQAGFASIRDDNASVIAVLITLEDRSEIEALMLRRTNERLQAKRRYVRLIDALQDSCIYFLNPDGLISEWSESAQRLHGFSQDQAVRMTFADLAAPRAGEENEMSEDAIRLSVDLGQWESNGWRLRASGEVFWGQTLITPLRDDNGELEGLACITRDMTAMKDLDRVMTDLNAELERRVKERVRQYPVPNKDLDVFTHSITHELRGPLRHINAFAGLIADELRSDASDSLRQYRDGMKRSSASLNSMIESLLNYSRLGRIDLHPSPFQAQRALMEVIGRIKSIHHDRNINWDIQADFPELYADEAMISDLFTHLLDNAVKFTRNRELAEIQIGSRTESDGSTIFFVVDNGVGFDLSMAKNLFLMFQRQHHSMDFEGHGAGLALSQRIVQRHNGTIWADSTPGYGCAVYFKLPLYLNR